MNNPLLSVAVVLAGLLLTPVGVLAIQQDDTGTNPVNLTYSWSTNVKMQDLGNGDNSYTSVTFQQKFPLGKKLSLRFRGRHNSLSLDSQNEEAVVINGVKVDGSSSETSGIGDMDLALTWIAEASQSSALVFVLEGAFPTASNVRLGSGKYTLAPTVFGVFFKPPGGGVLVAPAYKFEFSYAAGEEGRSDVGRHLFDLFYLWRGSSGKWWVLTDLQAVIDYENDIEFGALDVEYGRMMFAGLSSYWRPSIAIGSDRPYDWGLEIGLKVVWR